MTSESLGKSKSKGQVSATAESEAAQEEPTDTTEENSSVPSQEEIFEVLSNRRRRYVLAYLKTESNQTEVSTLATQVSAAENDVPVDQLEASQRKSTYVGLRQTHLPKMEEYNIIEYDSRRGEVELTDEAKHARMYLEYIPENDIPWSHHYLGISILMGLITTLAVVGVFPFTSLDGMAIAIITFTIVGFSAVVNIFYNRRNRIENVVEFERER
jgi:hypothetical protein